MQQIFWCCPVYLFYCIVIINKILIIIFKTEKMVIFLSSYLKHLDSESETDSSDSEDETKDKKLAEGEEKVKALSLSCYLNRYVGKVCKPFSYVQYSSWPIICAFYNEMSYKHSSLG